MPSSVALVTCADLPTGDPDDGELVAVLGARGIDARWTVWDDATVDWNGFQMVLVRSPWDYTARRDEFLDWAGRVSVSGAQLHNSAAMMRWNSDKRYLHGLSAMGLPIVPTTWTDPGTWPDWPDVEFVAKPSVGAGSLGAGRFDPGSAASLNEARDHVAMLHAAGRTVMVQPYLSAVDDLGERALVYFGGRFSHAVTKSALLPPQTAFGLRDLSSGGAGDPLFVSERIAGAQAAPAERAVGDAVLRFLYERERRHPLYARVDLLPGPDGPALIELELIEPSLFFGSAPGSIERYADEIAARLRGADRP